MVNNEGSWVYLLIGQDNIFKDAKLAKIKEDFLPKHLESFNSDTLFGRDLTLKNLQEKLLSLPVKTKKRLIIIKEAQALKDEVKNFLLSYCQKKISDLILVLDVSQKSRRDELVDGLLKVAQVFRCKETELPDAFVLWRQISLKRAPQALKILGELLKNGEKTERILGGLRYACLKDTCRPQDAKVRIKLLLNCDIDIKTGRLKADFALEKLVVSLCGLIKSAG